jgi:hypothetical protein
MPAICFRTEIPDYSDLEHVTFAWCYSVYAGSKGELRHDMPSPRGKPICTTAFEDANLMMHDLTAGRSCTGGILHLVNQTPVKWFSSKHQKTVQTAMYGSEFVATPIATEQIMDHRYTLPEEQ